ncbi:hypothetical protein EDL98_11175 [Ornithobacterium rhinotracheale]|uniref:hypothetical protein n=1 Tax=Ornithobacterium rhinotracheale TaxID=28251 RepID=UPI00129C38D7|nr:hypothetical protein [Ornithobacterium rhinotracheale]MRJ11626.1 hypothetical protein [Ornithobacterium rhinotracheale]
MARAKKITNQDLEILHELNLGTIEEIKKQFIAMKGLAENLQKENADLKARAQELNYINNSFSSKKNEIEQVTEKFNSLANQLTENTQNLADNVYELLREKVQKYLIPDITENITKGLKKSLQPGKWIIYVIIILFVGMVGGVSYGVWAHRNENEIKRKYEQDLKGQGYMVVPKDRYQSMFNEVSILMEWAKHNRNDRQSYFKERLEFRKFYPDKYMFEKIITDDIETTKGAITDERE